MAELRPHYIDVDLKKNTQYNVPVVTQNDTATHFIIRVTDDGLTDPELLDAYQEITMTSQRPDGQSFYLTGTRIPGTNEIEFHLGTDETASHGSVLASLQFYLVEDASRYTSAQFRYDVKKDLTKNYTPTQREETLVEVVLRDGPVAIQEAKDAKVAVDGALVELEQDKTAAIDRLDEVTEENKTVFRPPVNTFADLATTYPNPEHGTTVRVTSEAAAYRYSYGTWVKTDEYNPTAIDQVTAQLAEEARKVEALNLGKASKSEVQNLAINKAEKTEVVVKGQGTLSDFDESTRAAIQGLEPGTINAVLGPRNVTPENTNFLNVDERNIYNFETNTEGIRFATNGAEVSDPAYSSSDFIKVEAGVYVLGFPEAEKPYVLQRLPFYNSNKEFVDILLNGFSFSSDGVTSVEVTVPSDGYIRTSVTTEKKNSFVVAKKSFYNPSVYFSHQYKMLKSVKTIPDEGTVGTEQLINESAEVRHMKFLTVSKNLFDKENVELNKFYATFPATTDLPGYFVQKDFILLKGGQSYHINKVRRWNLCHLNGQRYDDGNTGDNNASVVLTPTEDSLLKIAGTIDNLDTIQIEAGTSETSYVKYATNFDKLQLTNEQLNQVNDFVKENNTQSSEIKVIKDGNSFTLESDFGKTGEKIKILTEKNGSSNGTFKFVETKVGEITIHRNGDDVTPLRVMNTTVGANHGFTSIFIVTMDNHGKTNADLGSVWTDGTTEYTLLKISGNALTFGCPYGVSDGVTTTSYVAPKANLTHSRGASNTTAINISNLATGQLYPSVNKISVSYLLDGKELTNNGTYFGNELRVMEQYNIMDYKSIIDYAQANVGKPFEAGDIDSVIRLSNIFTFTKGLKCSTTHSLRALKKTTLANCGFLQSAVMLASGYTCKRFMPYVKPKSGFDFSNGINLDTFDTSLLFTKEDLIDPAIPPTHFIDWLYDAGNNRKFGFTMGYIADKTNSKNADRLTNTTSLWDMRSTKKVYPVAIGGVTLNPGDYRNFAGFRNYIAPDETEGALNLNIVKDSKDTYLYADVLGFSGTLSKEMPDDIGKPINTVQNRGLTKLNEVSDAEGVVFSVTENGNAIFKL